MAYIPADARWYIADVVLEHLIQDDPRNVVHVNVHLIEAGSPEEAFDKAIKLGEEEERVYENSDGKSVHIRFRGLRELNVIHDELKDGAELFYEEVAGLSEDELLQRITPKEQLAVFAPRQAKLNGPNYMAKWIGEILEDMGCSQADLEGDQPA